MKRPVKLVISLLLVIVVFLINASPVLAAEPTLPDPPPRGTIEDPPPPQDTTSYKGGILFVKDSEKEWTDPQNQIIGEIHCNDNDIIYTRTVKTKTGLSIQGPISDTQTAGIIDAMKALREPSKVDLTYTMDGKAGVKREWTLKGIKYKLTRYRILAIRQTVPAENELIGYYDVNRPESLEVPMTESPHPAPGVPGVSVMPAPTGVKQGYQFIKVPGGADIKPDLPSRSFFDVFLDFFQPPEKPLGALFDYGQVTVLSGGSLAGSGYIGMGETISFRLPPGSYQVKALVRLLGISFNVDAGSASAATPILLLVTLQSVATIWYIFEARGKSPGGASLGGQQGPTAPTSGGGNAAQAQQASQAEQAQQGSQAEQARQGSQGNQPQPPPPPDVAV
jgi:hypothetical protein